MVRVLSEEFPVRGDGLPVPEDIRGPADGLLPAVLHGTEADLTQCEGADSEAESSSSFEVLLPDFSSLGLTDVKQSDTSSSSETTREKRSSTPEDDPRNVNKR